MYKVNIMPISKKKAHQSELQDNVLLLHEGIRERYAKKSMKVDELRLRGEEEQKND